MSAIADPKKVKEVHILKDGTVLDDITGHLVSYEDCPVAYHILAKSVSRRRAAERARRSEAGNG